MDTFLIGNDTAVITMLLLFITALLTKRVVPWWVYEDVLRQLQEYEEAAPELITEVKRLMTALEEREEELHPPPRPKVGPKSARRRGARHE